MLGLHALHQLRLVFHHGRHRALAKRHLGAGRVEHADGLVGQLAAADVARREPHGFGDGFVEQAHLEVRLHERRDAAQHRCSDRLARLFDLHHLEAAREGRILLEILLVFAPRRGRHRAQLAPRERRLEQVGRIALARLPARADHRMGLVDEQDDGVRALLHLVDHVLEPVLELALHARTGLQQAHVEHVHLHALQRRRHVAGGDAQGQAFDHRRLADAGLAGEDGVVLAPPHQDVDHLPNLGLAADHRIELAFSGAGREMGRELVECRRLAGLARADCVSTLIAAFAGGVR